MFRVIRVERRKQGMRVRTVDPAMFYVLNIGETAVDSLCGKLATYVTSTTPR